MSLLILVPSLGVVVKVHGQEEGHGVGSHPHQTTLEKKLGTKTSEAILQAIGEKQQLQGKKAEKLERYNHLSLIPLPLPPSLSTLTHLLLTSLIFPVMFEKLFCPDPSDVSNTS